MIIVQVLFERLQRACISKRIEKYTKNEYTECVARQIRKGIRKINGSHLKRTSK